MWEYFISKTKEYYTVEELNTFGAQGWELILITSSIAYFSYYFKRKKK